MTQLYRASIRALALLGQRIVDAAVARLALDLDSGTWYERYADLLDVDSADMGYRLVIAGELHHCQALT